MGEEYNLPSGLAGCEYYNRFTGASECRLPSKASDRNKALVEALQQLHLMQREINQLRAKLSETNGDQSC